MYKLVFAPQAIEDLSILKKSEPAAFKKAGKLLVELQERPKTGTGKPEPLSGDRVGQWSRRISQKHRLVYEIEEAVVKVDVLSAYGHYEDKKFGHFLSPFPSIISPHRLRCKTSENQFIR